MPYTFNHEVHTGLIRADYQRVEERPSGLVVTTFLAAVLAEVELPQQPSKLALPPEGLRFTPTGNDEADRAAHAVSDPSYQNLGELADASAAAWRKKLLGAKVLATRLEPAEIWKEERSPSGLIIGAEPKLTFAGLAATPHEISMLKRIDEQVASLQTVDPDVPGSYL
ncbi:MAG TPA: hypothetical protein VLF60_01560 [Candidatus Saccharimonadales bacterium]|nr:hypothetical protein [Candidatus Saccharimonadales bacterium]